MLNAIKEIKEFNQTGNLETLTVKITSRKYRHLIESGYDFSTGAASSARKELSELLLENILRSLGSSNSEISDVVISIIFESPISYDWMSDNAKAEIEELLNKIT